MEHYHLREDDKDLAEHPLKTGGTSNTWKGSRSLIHTFLWQCRTLEQLTMAVEGCHTACIVSKREWIFNSPTSVKTLTTWFMLLRGWNRAARLMLNSLRLTDTFCLSSSPHGKDGHLGEVTSAATAHLSTPWWGDMCNYSALKWGGVKSIWLQL